MWVSKTWKINMFWNPRKPATYRIPDENEIFADEDKPRRGRRSAPDPPKKRKSNNHGKAKLKKTLTLLERKQQKEEKKLKAAEEKSRAKGNSPAPIRIKISLKGKNGKNGSGANSRAQSDNESVDSEGPSLASKAESEISDPASDAEVCHNMHRLLKIIICDQTRFFVTLFTL